MTEAEFTEWKAWRKGIDARLAAIDTAISFARWVIPISITVAALVVAVAR